MSANQLLRQQVESSLQFKCCEATWYSHVCHSSDRAVCGKQFVCRLSSPVAPDKGCENAQVLNAAGTVAYTIRIPFLENRREDFVEHIMYATHVAARSVK